MDSTIFSFFSPGRRDPYFQVDCLLRPNTFEREKGINDELEITQFMSNYFVDSIIFHIATSLFILISHFSSSSSSSSSSSFLVYVPSLSTNILFFLIIQLSQIVDPSSVNGEKILNSNSKKSLHFFHGF